MNNAQLVIDEVKKAVKGKDDCIIKAFAGLANSGAPDQAALAVGISEALMCTATGIGTSTIAIIMYNVLTSKIDKLTYAIDEAGFSIVQTYASTHK